MIRKSLPTFLSAIFLALPLSTFAMEGKLDDLKTKTGGELGVTLAHYKYDESINIELSGTKVGVDAAGNLALKNDWFLRGDLRYVKGDVDYTGYGAQGYNTHTNEPDHYYEVQALFGKDIEVDGTVVSPYIGYGIRRLKNDGRGVTSTGLLGYRRKSNYDYIPIGFFHRIRLSPVSKLVYNLEYDHLTSGKQATYLSDVGAPYYDFENRQKDGYGMKGSVMYHQANWSIGPYFNYWHINDSENVPDRNQAGAYFLEPENTTKEIGARAAFTF